MKKIEVGMMVRIVDSSPNYTEHIGHVGRVVGRYRFLHVDGWEVEGAEPERLAWTDICLEPIEDDDDQASWEKVEQLTGWNPTKEYHHEH